MEVQILAGASIALTDNHHEYANSGDTMELSVRNNNCPCPSLWRNLMWKKGTTETFLLTFLVNAVLDTQTLLPEEDCVSYAILCLLICMWYL